MAKGATNEFDTLHSRLGAILQSQSIIEAYVVDDNLVAEMTPGFWGQIIDGVRAEDQPTLQRLQDLATEKGTGLVTDLPPDEMLDEALALVGGSMSPAAKALLERIPYRDESLNVLVDLLKKLGLSVRCFDRIDANVPPRTGRLYFLDYRMQPDPASAGQDASRLLGEILNQLNPTAAPPAAVLMSRGQDSSPTRPEWEQVARASGYFRFNFRYLEKSIITGAAGTAFLYFLLELFDTYPLGKAYFAQLRAMRDGVQVAAQTAINRIIALTPAEFGLFAAKHLGDDAGRQATRHLFQMFLELLEGAVKADSAVQSSFREFAMTLKTQPMRASADRESHALHAIHTDLLYDRTPWVLGGPVEFGDIYHRPRDPDIYYLVLTPECDLELRFRKETGDWFPKADEILMLVGQVTSEPPPKSRDDVIVKPFISDQPDKDRWIWWHLRRRVVASTSELMGPTPAVGAYALTNANPLQKWGRLRQPEAEQVQQKFASDFLEVGTDEVSRRPNVRSLEVRVLATPREPGTVIGSLSIVEMAVPADEKSPYWAFGEDSEQILCAERKGGPILSWTAIIEMRTAMPSKEFLRRCEQAKLFVRSVEGAMYLLACPKQVPKDWTPLGDAPSAEPS